MIKRDRRRGGDRRLNERYSLELEITCEATSGRFVGTMSDLSSTGCFVLAEGDVEDGDQIKVEIPLMTGGTVAFWGRVANHVPELGFGVTFTGLTDAQKSYLERFTDTLRYD